MNLRNFVLWFLLLLTLATVADAEPATKADLQTLELKLTKQMTDLEKRIDKRFTEQGEQIHELEKRIDKRFTEQDNQIHELEKRFIALEIVVRESNNLLANRIDVLYWAISALIGVVLAVIALPQVLGYLQGKRERANLENRIEALSQRVELQEREIKELKARRIVASS